MEPEGSDSEVGVPDTVPDCGEVGFFTGLYPKDKNKTRNYVFSIKNHYKNEKERIKQLNC